MAETTIAPRGAVRDTTSEIEKVEGGEIFIDRDVHTRWCRIRDMGILISPFAKLRHDKPSLQHGCMIARQKQAPNDVNGKTYISKLYGYSPRRRQKNKRKQNNANNEQDAKFCKWSSAK